MVAKNYSKLPNKSVSVDWTPLLKVWLFLLDRGNTSKTITNRQIAAALGMTEGTMKNARAALTNDIEAIIRQKKYSYDPEQYQPYRCLGSQITVTAWITENRPVP